jgi:hypothetical protein
MLHVEHYSPISSILYYCTLPCLHVNVVLLVVHVCTPGNTLYRLLNYSVVGGKVCNPELYFGDQVLVDVPIEFV